MSATLTVSGKVVGRRKPLFADWSIPLPPGLRDDGGRITLRDLIDHTVRLEGAAFRERQEERRFIRALTEGEIASGAARGKVDMGGRDLDQAVDEGEAVAAALQAFEDGIYLVIVDEQQQRELDREVHLRPDSQVTFVRLVMLAGG